MGFFKEKKDVSDNQEMEKPRNQILETPKEESGTEKMENKKASYDDSEEGTEKETEKKPEEETKDDLEKKKEDDGTEKLENRKANLEKSEDGRKDSGSEQTDKEKEFRDRLKVNMGNNTEKNTKGNSETNNNESSGAPDKDQKERAIYNPEEKNVQPEVNSNTKENEGMDR